MKSKPASKRPRSRWIRQGLKLAALVAIIVAYTMLAVRQLNLPQAAAVDPLEVRHLALAHQTQEDLKLDFSRSVSQPLRKLLPHRTDGVVQPLWPWIGAWMTLPAPWSHARTPAAAGWLQLGLTAGFLLMIGVACLRSFSFPAALLVLVLTGFDGLLPAVGDFTGAALFQVLFLLTWVICIYGMQRNSLWVYALAGAVGALAYLTDERALPLLGVFAAVSTLRALWQWLAEHWPQYLGSATSLWVPRNHALGLMLMAGLFVFIAGPRLAAAHERFGRPFFHYQNHVRWLEDAESASAWIETHPDAISLAALAPADHPSLARYLADHSQQTAWERLAHGMKSVLSQFSGEGGRKVALLVVILLAMAAALPLVTVEAQHAGQRLHPETVPAVFFMVLAAAVYVVIAGWDAPVSGTYQRLLPLLPPGVLGLLWGCESLKRRATRRQAQPAYLLSYQAVLWLMAGLEGWRIIQGLQGPSSAP